MPRRLSRVEGQCFGEVLGKSSREVPRGLRGRHVANDHQRKLRTSGGSPRHGGTCTAKASRINRTAAKSRCACNWGGWGQPRRIPASSARALVAPTPPSQPETPDLLEAYACSGSTLASSTASAPSLSCYALRRHSPEIRTGCANERSSGSVRGAVSNDRPYRDLIDCGKRIALRELVWASSVSVSGCLFSAS